jgi:hypothetical protein
MDRLDDDAQLLAQAVVLAVVNRHRDNGGLAAVERLLERSLQVLRLVDLHAVAAETLRELHKIRVQEGAVGMAGELPLLLPFDQVVTVLVTALYHNISGISDWIGVDQRYFLNNCWPSEYEHKF